MFDYLDGCDIYKAFSNLNIYFQNLLTCSSLLLKIDIFRKSQFDLQQNCRQIVIPNKHRIISLNLSHPSNIHLFLSMCTIDLSFNRLESLVLNGIRSYKLVLLLFALPSLPRLFSMNIKLDDNLHDLNDIYQLIFRLPLLKSNKFSLSAYEESILLPIAKDDQFSAIEYLDINHSCTLNELIAMLSYTPRLRHLICDRLIESDQKIGKEVLITLSKLTHLSIYRCNLLFDEFEIFIRKISSKVKALRVTTSWVETYLDADRWERLILQHMPHLRIFDFEYAEFVDSDFDPKSYHAQFNRFTSPFWVERRWRFELEIDNQRVFYSIHSNR
jgi:hypothetical protein